MTTTRTTFRSSASAWVEPIGESLVAFYPLPFLQLPTCDWIFFYSRRAVQFFFDQLPAELPEKVLLATIGPATARALTQRGHEASFIGSGFNDAF